MKMKIKKYKLCACGCGQMILVGKTSSSNGKTSTWKERRFVRGHGTRGTGKIKSSPQLCKCGCGGWTKEGNNFMLGHRCKKIKSSPQLCKCGCGEMTNEGAKYINYHFWYKDGKFQKKKDWTLAVKIRDNYICQKCGKENLKGHNCHAHHIKSKDEFPELIYDVNNGQTLCNTCHQILHRTGKLVSQETKEKIGKTVSVSLKKGYAEGQIISWAKGLTKETHPSIKAASEKNKGKVSWSKGLTKETHPSIKMQAEKMLGHKAWNKGLTLACYMSVM